MTILTKLSDKISDKLRPASGATDTSQSTFQVKAAAPAPALGPDSVFRYRKQRGVNLGSWFVLERWIADKPFRNAVAPGKSDHDIASGKDAKAILENHWDTWIKEEDWTWIKDHGFNSVRLPIGYYHLCLAIPDVIKKTDFEPFYNVYQGAWPRIQKAIQSAQDHGLGVFVDLHAAAGSQNGEDHSGISTGKANLLNSASNIQSTSLALRFLTSYLASKPNVVGLQLLNEPKNDNRLQGFYDSMIQQCRTVACPYFPLYVHDAWDTPHYSVYVGGKPDFVVVDHHLYRCFTPEDKALTGVQHAQKLRNEFAGTFAGWCNAAKGGLVVGEWSAALDDWNKGMSDPERDRNKREFVAAQLEIFNKYAAGWWFWTLKKGDGWDAGWSAKDAVTAQILPGWVGSGRFKGAPAQSTKDQALSQGQNAHTSYWTSHGGSPNPQVYTPGFSQGWDDALIFLSHWSGVSELGFLARWSDRRKAEYEQCNGSLGAAAWEWEHGFKEGVAACQQAALA